MSVKIEKTGSAPAKTEAATPATSPEQPAAHPLMALRRELDGVFDNFFRDPWRSPFGLRPFEGIERAFGGGLPVAPKVDVTESDKAFEITAELPGMAEKDVEVTLGDGILTVKGEKKAESSRDEGGVHLMERSYGRFERAFRVPDTVDPAKIEAEFENGVLKLTMPKNAKAAKSERRIEVKRR